VGPSRYASIYSPLFLPVCGRIAVCEALLAVFSNSEQPLLKGDIQRVTEVCAV
jgi:hypothetical protein